MEGRRRVEGGEGRGRGGWRREEERGERREEGRGGGGRRSHNRPLMLNVSTLLLPWLQQMRQNAEAILRSLTASPPTEQAKDLSQTLDRLLQESSRLEKVLNSRLSELRVFLTEYSALKSWLNDMNVSAQGEQHAVKRQVSMCVRVCVCVCVCVCMCVCACNMRTSVRTCVVQKITLDYMVCITTNVL